MELPVTNWKSRGETGLGKERNQELHFRYIKFHRLIGDLSKDTFKSGTPGRGPGQKYKSASHEDIDGF